MNRFSPLWLSAIPVLVSAITVASSAAEVPPSPEGVAFFEKSIRPLLVEHCYACHSAGAKRLRGGLHLDSEQGWLQGGDLGPAVKPGDPEESLLIAAVRQEDELLKMPPKGKLSAAEIALLTRWVAMGAPGPRGDVAPKAVQRGRGRHRTGPRVLGVPPAGGSAGPRRRRFDLAPDRARPVHPRRPRGKGAWRRPRRPTGGP